MGVAGSLRGFALGFDTVGEPLGVLPPPPLAGSGPAPPVLAPVGYKPYDDLLARAATLPAAAHGMLAEGLRHVVAFQDIAYGAAYLAAVEAIAAAPRARTSEPDADASHLVETAAKYIARAMVYDDVIRVAALKTQPSRADRVQREMGGRVIAVTEFMHPRMEELLGLLTPALGTALQRHPRIVAALGRPLCGPRRIRTDTILGFLMLYVIAGPRGWRRGTLRHAREWARIDAWLAQVRAVVAEDPALAAELLANQRLIKGYSETHSRGLDKYAQVMAAAERLRGRPDGAVWVRRLRQAALEDEPGLALRQALRTVDSFLDERQAA